MSKFNDDWTPIKSQSMSRKPSSIHQISQKCAPQAATREAEAAERSPQHNGGANQRRPSTSINLVAAQASASGNLKNKQLQPAAQNSQKYFKNYALINDNKAGQENGGKTVKELETAILQKEQTQSNQKK